MPVIEPLQSELDSYSFHIGFLSLVRVSNRLSMLVNNSVFGDADLRVEGIDGRRVDCEQSCHRLAFSLLLPLILVQDF